MSQRRPLLIALIGAAGAGKSTVAGHLQERWTFEEIAFADPIVNMIASLFADAGIGGEWITERSLKEQPTTLGFSYRRLAQTLGTEWGRGLDPDLWVKVAVAKVEAAHQLGMDVVISDCRFHNEADRVRALGGLVVRVSRPDLATLLGGTSQHVSEAAQVSISVDHVLFNNGSVATLEDQVDRLVESLRA